MRDDDGHMAGTAVHGPRPAPPTAAEEPITPAEIAALMREIAEADEIGVDDDFFHAGGNSWDALSLMVILAERSGVKLSLLDLFHTRTPSRLADLIAHRSVTER